MSPRSPRPPRRPTVSPLRYPGGKGALYSRLRAVLRENRLAGCTYVEPFAGGAGAGMSLLVTGQVSNVVINDLDPAIYAFWRLLLEDSATLINFIHEVPLTVTEWRRQKAAYSMKEGDWRALGLATFYLNRTNRSGVLNGGPIGGLDQKGNYLIDARFNRDDLAERVRTIALYRDHITATCRDGEDVIRDHAGRSRTFIYADPPYFEKAGSLYLNAFSQGHHESLAKTLMSRPKSHWLLTYDNVPQVRTLYDGRRIREFGLHYSAHRVMKATELVVLSDSLADVGAGWEVGA